MGGAARGWRAGTPTLASPKPHVVGSAMEVSSVRPRGGYVKSARLNAMRPANLLSPTIRVVGIIDRGSNSHGWVVTLVGLGIVVWVLLWLTIDVHASWDALFYHRFAAEYAGLPEPAQDAFAWAASEGHFDGGYRQWLIDHRSWPWGGWDDPMRERWIDQYRMRPVYPLLVAVLQPYLGVAAPVAVTLLATVGLVVGLGVTLTPILSRVGVVILVALLSLTPYFSQWLVFMQTDGVALALFATSMGFVALYIRSPDSQKLIAIAVLVSLLALARPLAVVVPAATGLSLTVALVRRDPVWRMFAAASVAAGAPVAAFAVGSSALGFPTIGDLLQDLPTRHFSQPDVPDPIGYIWRELGGQISRYVGDGLLTRPSFWVGLVGLTAAGAGYQLAGPSWWALPFVFSLPLALFTYILHPSQVEVVRTLAPAWVGIHLGISLLVTEAVRRLPRSGTNPAPAIPSG